MLVLVLVLVSEWVGDNDWIWQLRSRTSPWVESFVDTSYIM